MYMLHVGAYVVYISSQGDTSVVVPWYLIFFELLAPYVCFHSFSSVKVTEWPPIGKIAAHSAYDMFHGVSA